MTTIASIAGGALLVALACEAPSPGNAHAASADSMVSMSGGHACLREDTLQYRLLSRVTKEIESHHPAARADDYIAAQLDENCSLIRDTLLGRATASRTLEEKLDAVYPGIHQRAKATGMWMSSFLSDGHPKTPGPWIIYAVVPSKSYAEHTATSQCGFGSRSDEHCGFDAEVVMRRIDSVRLLIAIREAHPNDGDAPADHMFLISSAAPLSESLSQVIKFGHVEFQNNALMIENRVTTDPPLVFGSSRSYALSHKGRPLTRIDNLIGVAHYRTPVVTVDEAKAAAPTPIAPCDGSVGSCYLIAGRKIMFPA